MIIYLIWVILIQCVLSYDPIHINQSENCFSYQIDQLIKKDFNITNLIMYTNQDQIYINEKGCEVLDDQCELKKLNCQISQHTKTIFIRCVDCYFTLYLIKIEEFNTAINTNKENNNNNQTIEFETTYYQKQYYLVNIPHLSYYINFAVLNWKQNSSYLNYNITILSHPNITFRQSQIGSQSLRFQSQESLLFIVQGINGSILHCKIRAFDQELKMHLNDLIDESVAMGSSNSYLFEFVKEKNYQDYKNFTLLFEFQEQYGMAGVYIHQGQFPQLLKGYHWQSDSGTSRVIEISYQERQNKKITSNEDVYHITIFGKVSTSYTLSIRLKELYQQQINPNSLVQGILQANELQIFSYIADKELTNQINVYPHGNFSTGHMYCLTTYSICENKINQLDLTNQIILESDEYKIYYFLDKNKQVHLKFYQYQQTHILFLQHIIQNSLFIKNLNKNNQEFQLQINSKPNLKLVFQGQIETNNQEMNTTEAFKFEVPTHDGQLEFIEIYIDFIYGQSQFEFYRQDIFHLNQTRNIIPVKDLLYIPDRLDVYCTTNCVYQFYFKLIWKDFKNKTINSIIQLKPSQKLFVFCQKHIQLKLDSMDSKIGNQTDESLAYVLNFQHESYLDLMISFKSFDDIDHNFDQKLQSHLFKMLYLYLKPQQSAFMKINCEHDVEIFMEYNKQLNQEIMLQPNYPIKIKQAPNETIQFHLEQPRLDNYQLLININNKNQVVEFHNLNLNQTFLTQGGLFNITQLTNSNYYERFQFTIFSNYTVEYTVKAVYSNDYYMIFSYDIQSHLLPFNNKSIIIVYKTNDSNELDLQVTYQNKPILVQCLIQQMNEEQIHANLYNLSSYDNFKFKQMHSTFKYQIEDQNCSLYCYFVIKIVQEFDVIDYATVSIFQKYYMLNSNQYYSFQNLPQSIQNYKIVLDNKKNDTISLYFGYSKYIDVYIDLGCKQEKLLDMIRISLDAQQIFRISNSNQYQCIQLFSQNTNDINDYFIVSWSINNYQILQLGGDGLIHNYYYHPEIQTFIILQPNRYQFLQVFTDLLQPNYIFDYMSIELIEDIYNSIQDYKPSYNFSSPQIATQFEFKQDTAEFLYYLVRIKFLGQTPFQLLWATQNDFIAINEQCNLILKGLNQTINLFPDQKSQVLFKLLLGEIKISDIQNNSSLILKNSQNEIIHIPNESYQLRIYSSQNALYQLSLIYEYFHLNIGQIYTLNSDQKKFQYICSQPEGQTLNILFEMNNRELNCSFSLTIRNTNDTIYLHYIYFDKIIVPFGKSFIELNENCQNTVQYQFHIGVTLNNSLMIDFNRFYTLSHDGNFQIYIYVKGPSILFVDIQQEEGLIRSLISQQRQNIDFGLSELTTHTIQNQYKKQITLIKEEGFVYITNSCYNQNQLCHYKMKLEYLDEYENVQYTKGQTIQINNILQIKIFEYYQGFTIENVTIRTYSQIIQAKSTDLMIYTIQQHDKSIIILINIIIKNIRTQLKFDFPCEFRQKEVTYDYTKMAVIMLFFILTIILVVFLKRRRRQKLDIEFNIIKDATYQ